MSRSDDRWDRLMAPRPSSKPWTFARVFWWTAILISWAFVHWGEIRPLATVLTLLASYWLLRLVAWALAPDEPDTCR